ncbi:hypothetical protein DXG01_005288, partial [Tephrocybe rancida]
GTTPMEPQPMSPAAAGSNTSPNDTPITTWKRSAEAGMARPSKRAKTASMLAGTPAKSPGAQGLAEKSPHQDPDAHSSKKLKMATVSGTALAQPGPPPPTSPPQSTCSVSCFTIPVTITITVPIPTPSLLSHVVQIQPGHAEVQQQPRRRMDRPGSILDNF